MKMQDLLLSSLQALKTFLEQIHLVNRMSHEATGKYIRIINHAPLFTPDSLPHLIS